MKWTRKFQQQSLFVFFLTILLSCAAFSDEWKARHGLVLPPGAPDLGVPAAPDAVFLPGPQSAEQAEKWRAGIKQWRKDRLAEYHYSGSLYDRPELAWIQHVFSQCQLLVWDRSFYDPEKREYTVDTFLADLERRIGPIDAVLIWPVYPNLGVDDRNQFDLLRDLPGGIPGLRQVVEQFHQHGVRVMFPILAWDTGTRDEGAPPSTVFPQLLKEIGADGINFDTLESAPKDFRTSSDAIGHPLALEPQFAIHDDSFAWSNISWNDWVTWEDVAYPFVPMVSKVKWLEPRHAVNVTDRFTRDKTDSLQHAFFNGEGYATLENLWGFWYGMTPRDAETVLRITKIERAFPQNLSSVEWEPHVPTLQAGVFASTFPAANSTLWTIVNRNEYDVAGEELRVPVQAGTHYFDLWHGVELIPRANATGTQATLAFTIAALGFGAVFATTEKSAPSADLQELLKYMAARSAQPLRAYSREWKFVAQTMVRSAATKVPTTPPPGMLRIPEADYDFAVQGIEIEGGNDPGVDVQYPWEDAPRRFHRKRIHISSFYIDRTPVTNQRFKEFLNATKYRPADDHNFLRDWKNGMYPDGWSRKPVTWVSIEDARAYAAWAGKRLPHDWEWQYAAQSTDGRIYPWGNDWNAEEVPPADHGRVMRAPADVDAHAKGASAFGVLDLEGNISQWTDEFRDKHTRAAIIRGAASYQPRGSVWYFPQTYRLDQHQKYLLMSPSRDRSGTIGFRCVMDAQ
jgi:formylglycine-generating enzyme required for sulfatase activity